jgi:hypothetical protein
MWDVFEGIENVRATSDSTYFEPGRYIVKIDAVQFDKDRNKIEMFIVRTTVLAVLGTEHDLEGNPVVPNAVGTNPSIVHKNGGKSLEMFLPNVKAFVAAAAGVSPSIVTMKDIADCANNEPGATMEWPRGSGTRVKLAVQPVAGAVLEVNARMVRKVRSEGVITKVVWTRLVPPSQLLTMVDENVLARHFDLDELKAAAEAPTA